MTTDTDRVEELAKWHDREAVVANIDWHYEQAAMLRSLSADLTELRQAKESLDWWIAEYLSGRNFNWNLMPPYLKSRLEAK